MNHGVDVERELRERSTKDWIFGATSPKCIALIPMADRAKYLPVGEVQRGVEDFMDCASRGPVNILEAKFTWLFQNDKISAANKQWLRDKGYADAKGRVTFSDRYIAMRSGTTRQGNSVKGPVDTIHFVGLIPKKMLPAASNMTFDMYHDKRAITLDMIVLGAQFLSRFPINYDIVWDYQRNVADDMRDIGLFAWPEPVNGIYPRVPNDINHVVVDFADPQFTIFDNYIDPVDGDFVKRLAPDYNLLGYGYRLIVSEQQVSIDRTLLDLIISYLVQGRTGDAMTLITKQFGAIFSRPTP